MSFNNIFYSKDKGMAEIVINRPEKRNALNRAARFELLDALEDTRRDPSVRALVLSGAGEKSFIAGSDLRELSTFSALEMAEFLSTLAQRLYTQFEEMEKPVIAMIHGLCLGGGLELAMCCDIRIASVQEASSSPTASLRKWPTFCAGSASGGEPEFRRNETSNRGASPCSPVCSGDMRMLRLSLPVVRSTTPLIVTDRALARASATPCFSSGTNSGSAISRRLCVSWPAGTRSRSLSA